MTQTVGMVSNVWRRTILVLRWFEGTSDPLLGPGEVQIRRLRGVCFRRTAIWGVLIFTNQRLVFLRGAIVIDPFAKLLRRRFDISLSDVKEIRGKARERSLWSRVMMMAAWEVETIDGATYQFAVDRTETVVEELRHLVDQAVGVE